MKILLLEGNPAEAALLCGHLALQASGIQWEVAENARSLLDRLPAGPDVACSWDILLLSGRLPGSEVLGVLETVRQDRHLDLPMVLVIAPDAQTMIPQAMQRGASDYLIKHAGYLDLLPKVLEIAHQRARLDREHKSLKESEERFREVFLNMKDGVAIYDAVGDGDDFVFQQLNPAGAELGQVAAEAVLGRSVQEVFPGIREMGLLEVFRDVWRTGRPRRHPLTLYRDDQLQMWVENYVCRLGSGSIVAIYQDMTARKKVEEELRQSEQILRSVIDTSPNCVFVKNDKSAYVLANKAVADLYGVSFQEIIGTTEMELARRTGMKLDDARRFSRGDATVIRTQEPITIERDHFTRMDGSTLWFKTIKVPIDLPGHPRCVLGVHLDITDQVAAEEQQSLLFTAIEQSPEAVIITDREGTIQFVNPAFETITGFARQEAIGRNPRILKSDAHDAAFYHNMWETLVQGDTWRGRIVNRKKDGTKYTEEATISPVRSRGGKVMHYVAVKRDISRELETETRLRQSQKMEAIGTLAGGIAHDFNNILTSAIGFTELALDEAAKGSRLEGYLKEIFIAGMRARDLVAQILTFARQSEETVKPVQVGMIVQEVVKLLRPSVPSSIDIRQTIESDGQIMADPTQIHQVCMNLCTNAVQAMEDRGGVLEIRVGDAPVNQGISGVHGNLAPGRYLVLAVSDTGCGIPPDIMETIFEPYFTTKGVGAGTGLGLSVVHGIVKSCGGEISVQSGPGNGAAFTIYLPRADAQKTMAETTDAPDLPTGTEHVLIVDDELVIAKMAAKALERRGYRTTIRTSSVEALALFQSKTDQFDLVITDMTMPNLTGELLAAEMLKLRPDLPVILCTGFSKKISDHTVAALGIRSLIMKPFSTRDLLNTVRRVLDGGQQ